MKILSIQPTNYSFKAKRNDYITKSMLATVRKEKKHLTQAEAAAAIATAAASVAASAAAFKEILKEYGLTYWNVIDKTLQIASGYNGGFFTMKYENESTIERIRERFLSTLLRDNNLALGGLMNYKEMTNSLKRQDIIQKGLHLHTYELNRDVSYEDADAAAETLSKLAKKHIKPKDLFFLDTEAFYYDNLDKTAYSINVVSKTYGDIQPTYRTCRFDTDEKGNAIGYTVTAMDIFQRVPLNKTYSEQQEISENLPKIADSINNKLFAEAFRFGNTKELGCKIKRSVPVVLEHLSKRVGVKNPNEKQLQFVKYYDKDKNIISRICYYDPTTGRSLLYNDEGKYLSQMEYNKDAFGNIVACAKY